MKEVTDERELQALKEKIGFKGRVFVEKTDTSVTFVGDNCYMCEKPWKVKLDVEDIGDVYLCDEHLDNAKKKWKRPIKIVLER